jgi:hypothetical protein
MADTRTQRDDSAPQQRETEPATERQRGNGEDKQTAAASGAQTHHGGVSQMARA